MYKIWTMFSHGQQKNEMSRVKRKQEIKQIKLKKIKKISGCTCKGLNVFSFHISYPSFVIRCFNCPSCYSKIEIYKILTSL